MKLFLFGFLTFCAVLGGGVQSTRGAADETKQVLLIAGKPSHGYGSHEHLAGCRILANALHASSEVVNATVVRGWPADESLLLKADTIVIYSDGGVHHPAIGHLEQLDKLLKKGKGFVCLHYAVEVPKGPAGNRFLGFLGGYFETDWSVNPHWTAQFKSLPTHPTTHGVAPFTAHDEWYFHMRFIPAMKGVTPILSAVPPESTLSRPDGPHSGNPEVRKEVAQRLPQHVAWVYDRPDGGRSFGFTGGHFHWNWGNQDLQKLVVNAIAWTAGHEIPTAGIPVRPAGVAELQAGQDYPQPAVFSAQAISKRFGISTSAKSMSTPKKSD